MPDLASIYQRVIDAVGERARVTRDGEQLQWHATYGHWCYVGHIVATRSHPTDAANAIRCWWEDMIAAKTVAFSFRHDPPAVVVWDHTYTAPTLIEALAAAVQGECKP